MTDHEIRLSEEKLRVLIESSPDGMVVHQDGVFAYVNPAFLRMLGYDEPSEIVGKLVTDIAHPDEWELMRERRELSIRGDVTPPAEFRMLRRDGTWMWVEIASIPALYDGVTSVIATVRDLTERKAISAKMMEVDRMVAVATLASGVGHEINNPLTYVMVNIDLIREDVRGEQRMSREEILKLLDSAHMGTIRIRDIVRDLSTLSRRGDAVIESINLADLLDSSINICWNTIRHRAKLVKEIGELPRISGHLSKLGQVFVNLLMNAAQAIEVGDAESNQICVRAFVRDEWVVVEIEDTGSGISKGNLSQIFDPFFTTKPVGEGTGLGLPISRKTVELLGGRLEVESQLGRGSTFRILLPQNT